MEVKHCSKCGKQKPKSLDCFGLRNNGKYWKSVCRDCEREAAKEYRLKNPEYKKQYYKKNKEIVLAKNRENYYQNKEKRNQKQKEWYQKKKESRSESIKRWQPNNKEKWRAIRRKWERDKRATDNKKVVSERISASMRRYLRDGRKGESWRNLVDFTPEQLTEHIEKHFKPGMSWGNRHLWHIDHIKPISAFSFSSPSDPQFRECWCLNNLQPLWAEENILKSNHYGHR